MSGQCVLVTGANGYLGLAISRALRARGNTVYGLVRSQDSAQLLQRHEIIPLVSTVQEAPKLAKQFGVMAIVEAHSMTDDFLGVTSALLDALESEGRYVYMSGCLVYGDRPSEECLESDPVPQSKRADVEQVVLRHSACGTVLRPAFVFGGDGGHYASRYWKASENGLVTIAGDANKAWAWVHMDDVADAVVLALAAPEKVVRGEVFNLSDGTKTVFSEIVAQMAQIHTGAQDLKANIVPADTAVDKALDKSCYYKADKARRDLGWVPTRVPFPRDLQTYYRSWKACL